MRITGDEKDYYWVGLIFVALFIAIVSLIPFVEIWALNTLFRLGIPYAFSTWFALILLHLLVFTKLKFVVEK